ncbi:hypothetical protein AMK21_30040 [Streptomyces sp. CB00316]|uniref:hypothetical protein n=1 Tax=Streptomyces sp. CB00316 TaxID=1703932 RepID=UPI00093C979F|nr:hypothetical protein [Streptomyces sp. CB00316]OKJ10536.1 hypothetical protein AMK21_30040 [Streptomyces sp. CB00316]
MDHAHRPVDLAKATATYYVIVDDQGIISGKRIRPGWTPERDVLDVQRASEHSVERELQRVDFTRACFGSLAPMQFLTVDAVSHGHAAWLVKNQFALDRAFASLTEVFYADELAFDAAAFDKATG